MDRAMLEPAIDLIDNKIAYQFERLGYLSAISNRPPRNRYLTARSVCVIAGPGSNSPAVKKSAIQNSEAILDYINPALPGQERMVQDSPGYFRTD